MHTCVLVWSAWVMPIYHFMHTCVLVWSAWVMPMCLAEQSWAVEAEFCCTVLGLRGPCDVYFIDLAKARGGGMPVMSSSLQASKEFLTCSACGKYSLCCSPGFCSNTNYTLSVLPFWFCVFWLRVKITILAVCCFWNAVVKFTLCLFPYRAIKIQGKIFFWRAWACVKY